MPEAETTTAETVRDLMEELHKPQIMTIPARASVDAEPASVLVVPKGMEVSDLEKHLAPYRAAPTYRRGVAALTSLESFIVHTKRFADTDSMVFACPIPPSVTSVLDYNTAGPPGTKGRWGKHRATYAFPLSVEWKAWEAVAGKILTHPEFAELIEDRIGDVQAPPDGSNPDDQAVVDLLRSLGAALAGPTRLLELSRGLKVNADQKVKSMQNLSTGEVQLSWEVEHRDDAGAPLTIPNMFLIGIPIFAYGAPYRIPVRLRYRVAGGAVKWILQPYRPEVSLKHAFDEAVLKVETETGLAVLQGAPEA